MSLTLQVVGPSGQKLGGDAVRAFAQGGSIGRADTNDWVLPDPERFISSHHAVVELRGSDYVLVDNSVNGTYVNAAEQPLGFGNTHTLSDGDRIIIGEYEIVAKLAVDAPRADEPAWPEPVATPPPSAPASFDLEGSGIGLEREVDPLELLDGKPGADFGIDQRRSVNQADPFAAPPGGEDPFAATGPGGFFKPPETSVDPFAPRQDGGDPGLDPAAPPADPGIPADAIPEDWDKTSFSPPGAATPPAGVAPPAGAAPAYPQQPTAAPPPPAAPFPPAADPFTEPSVEPGFAPPADRRDPFPGEVPGAAPAVTPQPGAAMPAPAAEEISAREPAGAFVPPEPQPFDPRAEGALPGAPFGAPADQDPALPVGHPGAPPGDPSAPPAPPGYPPVGQPAAGFSPAHEQAPQAPGQPHPAMPGAPAPGAAPMPGQGQSPQAPQPGMPPAAVPPVAGGFARQEPYVGQTAPEPGTPQPGTAPFGTPPGAVPQPPGQAVPRTSVSTAAPAGPVDPAIVRLLQIAGLDENAARTIAGSPELGDLLGYVLRILVQGLMDLLSARAEIKNEFRVNRTQIRPQENNPLKFCVDANDAMFNLLVKRDQGGAFLDPASAFQEAIDDMKAHQMAMMAGMRAAFDQLMRDFDPVNLQELFDGELRRNRIHGLLNKTKYWDMLCERFESNRERDSNFDRLFGEPFARAYEEQMSRLSNARRMGR